MSTKENARATNTGESQIYEIVPNDSTRNDKNQALLPLIQRMRTSVSAKKTDKFGITRTALTPEQIQDHLDNKCRRGLYYIEPGASFCRAACFDLDDHEKKLELGDILKHAESLYARAELAGLKANGFTSSSGHGVHIYFIWDTNQDAYSVRQLLFSILESAGYSRDGNAHELDGLRIETFPKQDSVPINGMATTPYYPCPIKASFLKEMVKIWLG